MGHIGHEHEHEHEHTYTHSHPHDHEGGEHGHSHEHEHTYAHSHPHSHDHGEHHTHDHEHENLAHDHDHHDHDHGHSHEHTHPHDARPAEELFALMKYMAGHNAAHTRELEGLANDVKAAENAEAYDLIMEAVRFFDQGNEALGKALEKLPKAE